MKLIGMSQTNSLDMGANLLDEMFRGIYRGKQVHAGL